jgi:hypothetical protein
LDIAQPADKMTATAVINPMFTLEPRHEDTGNAKLVRNAISWAAITSRVTVLWFISRTAVLISNHYYNAGVRKAHLARR